MGSKKKIDPVSNETKIVMLKAALDIADMTVKRLGNIIDVPKEEIVKFLRGEVLFTKEFEKLCDMHINTNYKNSYKQRKRTFKSKKSLRDQ